MMKALYELYPFSPPAHQENNTHYAILFEWMSNFSQCCGSRTHIYYAKSSRRSWKNVCFFKRCSSDSDNSSLLMLRIKWLGKTTYPPISARSSTQHLTIIMVIFKRLSVKALSALQKQHEGEDDEDLGCWADVGFRADLKVSIAVAFRNSAQWQRDKGKKKHLQLISLSSAIFQVSWKEM